MERGGIACTWEAHALYRTTLLLKCVEEFFALC